MTKLSLPAPVLFPFLLATVPRYASFEVRIIAGLAAFDELVFIGPQLMEGQLPACEAVREILCRCHGLAHWTLSLRLHPMCLRQSYPHAAALGTPQLDVDHRRDRSLGL